MNLYLLCATLFVISLLYSCVGQAGASAYIAAMALFGMAPEVIKPTALVLNVLVALVVSIRFLRAGHFSWRLLWPFVLLAVPAAVIGGFVTLPPLLFHRLLGGLLLAAAFPFLIRRHSATLAVKAPSLPTSLTAGAGIGFFSGLTGVGGGILINPLLLHARWAHPRTAASVSAVFILINSMAALAGHLRAVGSLPSALPLFALSVVLGGAIGSQLGSSYLPAAAIYRILGAILFIAGAKLVFT